MGIYPVAIVETTARSCVINRYVSPYSRCRSLRRVKTCACTETSRAEVGSSHTITSGSEAELWLLIFVVFAHRKIHVDTFRHHFLEDLLDLVN